MRVQTEADRIPGDCPLFSCGWLSFPPLSLPQDCSSLTACPTLPGPAQPCSPHPAVSEAHTGGAGNGTYSLPREVVQEMELTHSHVRWCRKWNLLPHKEEPSPSGELDVSTEEEIETYRNLDAYQMAQKTLAFLKDAGRFW
ncbi:hypothetical protein P7K49_026133 [Saguinus oedipus]|uniref:Uncharacterized protein n=1 Tax=Saguinus oedipus TaxID=9490 RepID=A0ABQ9UJ41_SAGOE|nr:hypothetical protein P7K49_026133 [Saguinus oedipus]